MLLAGSKFRLAGDEGGGRALEVDGNALTGGTYCCVGEEGGTRGLEGVAVVDGETWVSLGLMSAVPRKREGPGDIVPSFRGGGVWGGLFRGRRGLDGGVLRAGFNGGVLRARRVNSALSLAARSSATALRSWEICSALASSAMVSDDTEICS